jgi:hypothetical protein
MIGCITTTSTTSTTTTATTAIDFLVILETLTRQLQILVFYGDGDNLNLINLDLRADPIKLLHFLFSVLS